MMTEEYAKRNSMIRKGIPLLIVVLTLAGCLFQSDETPRLNNPLDPNSDAYVEAAVSELNIENGQKFYTSELTATWKGNTYASEYQCVLEDSIHAWNTSSWIKLNDLTPQEYLFKVTPRNQAGFNGKTVDCLFTVLESPAVDSLNIKNGQTFSISNVDISWKGNTTAKSYRYSLNDQSGEWSDAIKASFKDLEDGAYTLTITAKNEDITGTPKTWTFIVNTSTARLNISGTVAGANEVTILLGGDSSETRITGEGGIYSFKVMSGGTYTLTPQKPGYSFMPVSVNLDGITMDITQYFTATLNRYTISGTVTGADGVTVQLTGDSEESVTVNDGGSYSFTVDALGNYAIVPRKDGYSIFPGYSIYKSPTQNIIQDLEAERIGVLTIRGQVTGLDDVTVRLSGDMEYTQIIGDGDRYEFIVDEGGTYTVSVFKEESMFDVYEVTYVNVAQNLIQDFNGQVIPENEKNQFLEYVKTGNIAKVEFMLEEIHLIYSVKDTDGYTPLHWAAMKGNIEIVEKILSLSANMEAKDHFGRTPLYMAAMEGQMETAQLFLDWGADFEVKDIEFEIHFLHLVVQSGDTDMVQFLLDQGVDIEAKNFYSMTSMHYAASRGNVEMLQLLISRGANVNVFDDDDRTPLYFAPNSEIVQILLNNGADIEAQDWMGTKLHQKARDGNTEMVQFLLDKGANVNALNISNETPLDLAENNGYTETAEILRAAGGKRFSEL